MDVTPLQKQISLKTCKPTRFDVIAGVITFIFVGLFIAAPRSSPVLMPLMVLVITSWFYARQVSFPSFNVTLTPLALVLALFGAWLVINGSWSVAPFVAYGKIALYFLLISLTFWTAKVLARLDHSLVVRLSLNLVLAVIAAGAVLAIEVLFDAPIRKAVMAMIPALAPSPKHARIVDGVVMQIAAYTLNRPVAALCLLLWPALLAARFLFARPAGRAISALVVSLALIAIFFSRHESSMLAIIFSVAVFAAATLAPRLAPGLTAAGWIVATLLVVPIAHSAFSAGLHDSSSFVPRTGKARIIIWEYTARQVAKQPFSGVGIQSTKPLDEARLGRMEKPAGFVFPLRTSRHAHNVYLQTWYELGAVGALLLCLCGLVLLRWIWRLDGAIRPYALATFVAAAVIAAFSWGMWQPWFMAAFAMSTLTARLAIELARRVLSSTREQEAH